MGWPVVLAPIPLYRGDSRAFTFKFWTDPAKTIPADLTLFGTLFALMIRTSPDGVPLATLTVDSTGAATGVLATSIPPAEWAVLPKTTFLGWDLQVSRTDGSAVTTLLASKFEVTKDYTHG